MIAGVEMNKYTDYLQTRRFNDDELKALQWLWKSAPSKCGPIFEMDCDEHDTCEQRKKVRKAFPFLEDMN